METAFLKAFHTVCSPEGLYPMLVPKYSTKDVALHFLLHQSPEYLDFKAITSNLSSGIKPHPIPPPQCEDESHTPLLHLPTYFHSKAAGSPGIEGHTLPFSSVFPKPATAGDTQPADVHTVSLSLPQC